MKNKFFRKPWFPPVMAVAMGILLGASSLVNATPQPQPLNEAPRDKLIDYDIGVDKHTGQRLPTANAPLINASTPQQRAQIEREEADKEAGLDPRNIFLRAPLKLTVEPGITLGARETLGNAAAQGEGTQAYLLIQFPNRYNEAARASLEKAGIVFFDYYKNYAFTAKVPPAAQSLLQEMANDGRIRFLGDILATSKIEASLLTRGQSSPSEAFPIIVQLYEPATTAQLDALRSLMQVDTYKESALNIAIGTAPGSNLSSISALPFVRWVEEALGGHITNLEGTMGIGGDLAVSGGYTGSGVRVSVVDSGIARSGTTYHSDLPSSRIPDQYDFSNGDSNASDDNSHGTHTAGSIAGAGVVSDSFRGQAPGASLLPYKILNSAGNCSGDCNFDDALSRSASNNANVSNNSWGGGNGSYDTISEYADKATRGFWNGSDSNPQYINVIAATGNDNNLVIYPASGKNTIAVGAVKDGNWPNSNIAWSTCTDTDWAPGDRVCFSNYGPLDTDGNGNTRVKPDVVAPGVRTYSTAPWYLYGDNRMYQYKDGTSMATPMVAGAVALTLDAYGNSDSDFPWEWPEVVKALMLATATRISSNTSLYGRGMVDVYHMIWEQSGINDVHFWGDSLASDGDEMTFNFSVPAGFSEVRVVLTWNDPPGSTEGINDLDLRVYDGGGTQVGSSTTYDDNVEYVRVTSGASGTWQFKVKAYDITQSSPQYFGLAVNVIKTAAALSLSASANDTTISPGQTFYIETNLSNSGYTAAGTWMGINPPTGFNLVKARVYPEDTSRYFEYPAASVYLSSGGYYQAASGEVVSGYPRKIRWYFQATNSVTLGSKIFYINGDGKNVSAPSSTSVTISVVDETPPNDPTSIWSTSHITQTWSADTTVQVCWSGASDSQSGVYGYGTYWSTSPIAQPSAIVDTTGTCETSASLATSNSWYFHLRTKDNADNWSSTIHFGPFYIDGSAPNSPVISETHIGSTSWSNHSTPYFSWSVPGDSGSGVASYQYSLDGGSATSLGNVTSHHPTLSDGTHTYKLKAVDAVGNTSSWSNVITRNIDTTPPTAAASSPTTSTTSCFVVSWSGSDALSGIDHYDVQYKVDGFGWNSWLDLTTAVSATFCGWAGYTHYFQARAQDNAGTHSSYVGGNGDTSTYIVPNVNPASAAHPISPYWHNAQPVPITYTATDDHGVVSVTLYRRYSADEISWSPWSTFTAQAVTGTSLTQAFTYTFPLGQGHYQFYTIAKDDAGLTESAPDVADAAMGYDTTSPTNPTAPATERHSVVSGTWQTTTNDPAFTWSGAADSLSGINGYTVYWGPDTNGVASLGVPGVYVAYASYVPGPVAEGSINYLRVRARDNAGNDAASWQTLFVFMYGAPPTADFSASPLTGTAPLDVVFTNTSTGTIASSLWSFGDGVTSTATDPSHLYTSAGTYTVGLTVSGSSGSDPETKANYIHVYNSVVVSFTAEPLVGYAPLTVTFTDTSTGDIASRLWSFGDGGSSTVSNPTHVYSNTGVYTVTLTVNGLGGDSKSKTKPNYVTVQAAEGSAQGQVDLQGRGDETGAVVSFLGSLYTTTVGSDGQFALRLPAGTYTVTAQMSGYLTASGRVTVSPGAAATLGAIRLLGGSVDGDADIDIYDLVAVAAAFGSSPPANPNADINGDGRVNIMDIALVGINFGTSGPLSWPEP